MNLRQNSVPMSKSFAVLLLVFAPAVFAQPRPFTLDDEMKLRTIVDVKISPDGQQVAYVVSTPNLDKNQHEGALYIGSTRLGEKLRIFNTPIPAPRLRWSPDGTMLSLLAFAGDKPQIFAIPISGGDPRALTEASEGVSGFEWSPDGKSIAYLTRDPTTKPLVIQSDAHRHTQHRWRACACAHADVPLRRQFLVGARRIRDRVRSGTPQRLHVA